MLCLYVELLPEFRYNTDDADTYASCCAPMSHCLFLFALQTMHLRIMLCSDVDQRAVMKHDLPDGACEFLAWNKV